MVQPYERGVADRCGDIIMNICHGFSSGYPEQHPQKAAVPRYFTIVNCWGLILYLGFWQKLGFRDPGLFVLPFRQEDEEDSGKT